MPLVQAAQGVKAWAKATIALTVGMVVVTAVFGALVGAFGGAMSDYLASRTLTAQIMKTAMVSFGSLMLLLGLGELRFIRRLLPDTHFTPTGEGAQGHSVRDGWYRRALITGASLAVTFGIICTRPTYLALLLYVAVVGSAAYGAAALGAYGIGLAVPVVLGGRILFAPTRAMRVVGWLQAREEGLRLAQGVLLALFGATVVAYFWFRYAIPSG